MADKTKIEWTDATWNVINGCSVISPGCTNCYAMRVAGTRLRHHPSRKGLTEDSKAGPVWNGQVRLHEPWLRDPLRWKRPRRIFVCAHGDLFHEAVPDEWLDLVFAVMKSADHHVFQVLTKRPERAREYLTRAYGYGALANVWLGVSVEDQTRAEERIPVLLKTPAHVRWISAEPLLGAIDVAPYLPPYVGRLDSGSLDWVVVGGESGPGARPMQPDWVRDIRRQCAHKCVPFLFKQWGGTNKAARGRELDGQIHDAFPEVAA